MLHVTNWTVADIGTGVAAADMAQQGLVCKVTDDGSGRRLMTVLADTDDALVLAGNYAIAMKVDTDANQVDEVDANVDTDVTGDRRVMIKEDDLIMEVRRGAKVEYSADLLHDSLNPAAAGTTPSVGDALGISGGKFATIAAATSAGIASPVVARVHKVFGTNVVIELL